MNHGVGWKRLRMSNNTYRTWFSDGITEKQNYRSFSSKFIGCPIENVPASHKMSSKVVCLIVQYPIMRFIFGQV